MSEFDDRSTAVAAAHPDDLAASAEDGLIGQTLHDTYKVVRFLAEGGMGRVYEAQHTRIATKRFAIKVLLGELKHSLEVRMRFRREAEAAASVDHPNVVGVHDFGYAPDGRPYLVCDYLEGQELGALLENGRPLDIPIATSITRQLCRALECAHDKGVIHRDLKPANVFLVGSIREPEVRVLDFGLSRVVELAEPSVTQTGMVMGTPSYMSPEQARGERADHRVDIYGVGAVLYACLTGRPPFDEETPHKTVLAVMSSDPPRPCALVPAIPPELELIVQRAMARDPLERYPTMRELDNALARFDESYARRPGVRAVSLHDSAPKSIPPAADNESEAIGVRRRAVAWLLLASLLLIIGAASSALAVYTFLAPTRPLLPTEIALASVAVLGSVFTPTLLLLRWLRRNYWNSSARMVGLVSAVRAPVLAGAVVYGIAALLARGLDAFAPHVEAALAPHASGWIGWAPCLFVVAVLAGAGALIRNRVLAGSTSLLKHIVAGPIVLGAVTAGSLFVVAKGYDASRGAAVSGGPMVEATAAPPIVAETSAPSAKPPVTAAVPAGSASAKASASVAASSSAEPSDGKPRATSEELATAQRDGLSGWMALRTRYPSDPAVLEPLAVELGKEPERTSELLRVLDVLFLEAPKKAEDAGFAKLVRAAAMTPATSQRAVDLMRTRMGLRGAEILFDLMVGHQELRGRTRAALDSAEVQRILSPALKIAFDLYAAPSCKARVELLPQAVKDGDARSITVLTLFSSKTKSGCGGAKRNKPCPAPCATEAPALEQGIKSIRERLEKTPQP